MRQYITRRLLQMIPVLIGVSIVIFFILKLAPGDALTGKMDPHLTPERKQELRHQMGLDLPVYKQYLRWAGGMLHGDLGESTNFKQPVGKVMNTYIWNTFILSYTFINTKCINVNSYRSSFCYETVLKI